GLRSPVNRGRQRGIATGRTVAIFQKWIGILAVNGPLLIAVFAGPRHTNPGWGPWRRRHRIKPSLPMLHPSTPPQTGHGCPGPTFLICVLGLSIAILNRGNNPLFPVAFAVVWAWDEAHHPASFRIEPKIPA